MPVRLQRMEPHTRPLIGASFQRFLLSGAFNTAITYCAYLALLHVVQYQVAYTLAYGVGVVLAYGLNRYVVFKSHRGIASIVLLPGVYLIQYLFGMLVLWLWVDWAQLNRQVAPLIVITLSVPLTYVLMRVLFVKRRP